MISCERNLEGVGFERFWLIAKRGSWNTTLRTLLGEQSQVMHGFMDGVPAIGPLVCISPYLEKQEGAWDQSGWLPIKEAEVLARKS